MALMWLCRVQKACYWTGQPRASVSRVARWHSGGRPILYLAESPALATLEGETRMMSQGLAVPEITCAELILVEVALALPDDPLPSVDPATLPVDWRRIPNPHSMATQVIGNAWLDRRDSLALRVPSSALPDGAGWNVLLNAAHPEYPNEFPPERIRVTPFDLRHYLGLPSTSG
jgi:RES domain-containing protein